MRLHRDPAGNEGANPTRAMRPHEWGTRRVYHSSLTRGINREEFVPDKPSFGHRFGSGIIALVLPLLGLFAERLFERYLNIDHEITRAVIAVACICLLLHSWLQQRKYSRSSWELGFWTSILTLPLLGVLWLGLNSFRGYLYPSDFTDSEVSRYYLVCQLQDWDKRLAVAMAVVAAVWGASLSIATIISRQSQRG